MRLHGELVSHDFRSGQNGVQARTAQKLWSSGNESGEEEEEEEEEEGLGIWRTCFTPSQCKELKAYYFQWMNRLQRQAVERVIKESERTTERAHENNSSQGETDHLNACYLGHYMPWISAQHHVMQRFITNHCLCCEGLFMMNLIYFIIVELCHFVYRTKSNLYIAFFF